MHAKAHMYSLGKKDFQTTYIRERLFTYCHKLCAKKLIIEPSGKINLVFTRTLVKFFLPSVHKVTLKHIV